MICAWEKLLNILPQRLRPKVDEIGKNKAQELRLRINAPPELVTDQGIVRLSGKVAAEELHYVINAASRYSPWAAATAAQGYLTAPGGHRIGICGSVVLANGQPEGIREPTSLCIRVARDFPGIAEPTKGSCLILGAPGWGKTTLLRDLIRQVGKRSTVCTVDERGELLPGELAADVRSDILTGCPKAAGIPMALRCMGPEWIAVDEITAARDVAAIVEGIHCGVHFLATAHAASLEEFFQRPVYQPLVEHKVFPTIYILKRDKHYTRERVIY